MPALNKLNTRPAVVVVIQTRRMRCTKELVFDDAWHMLFELHRSEEGIRTYKPQNRYDR